MTNTEMLQSIINDRGVKIRRIREILGCTYPTWQRRMTGRCEFTQSEIVKLRDFLHLTDDEVEQIFLS